MHAQKDNKLDNPRHEGHISNIRLGLLDTTLIDILDLSDNDSEIVFSVFESLTLFGIEMFARRMEKA